EFVHGLTDRLALERRELESFDQRARVLQATIGEAEKRMETLAARDRQADAVAQRFDHLSKQLEGLHAAADDLQRKQASLNSLQGSLAGPNELERKTTRQYDALTQSRQELEGLRKELQDASASYAAATQLGARLSSDRAALESFMERMGGFAAGVP